MTVVITVTVYTFNQTPLYRATTTLIVEPHTPEAVSFGMDSFPGEEGAFYTTQWEIIKSYAVAKKAFNLLELSGDPAFIDAEDPIEMFRRGISIDFQKTSRLVKINFVSADPERAAKYANAVAQAYIQHNLEDKRSTSKDAFTWLSEQIAVLRASIEKSEMELLKFKEKEDIISLEKRQSLLEEKLSTLYSDYTRAANKSLELKTTLDEVEKLMKSPELAESLPKIIENSYVAKLKMDYSELNNKLAEISKKYKPKHPVTVSITSQIDQIKESLAAEIGKIAKSIEIEYKINKANEEATKNNLDSLKQESMQLAQQAIQYGAIKRETESSKQMYDVLLQRLKETDISGSITSNNIRVVDEAKIPANPFKPEKKKNIITANIVGFCLGIFLCFLFSNIDDTIKTEDDIKSFLKEHFWGSVPKDKNKITSKEKGSVSFLRSYNNIKTRLGFYRREHVLKTIMISSSVVGEGKTTSAISLGIACAEAGERVLMIDADIFNPQLGKLLGVNHEAGITDFFFDKKDKNDIIVNSSIPNLSVIPSGLIPPNPGAVLESEKLKILVEAVRDNYDIVIIDTPPFNLAIEVSFLASYVDGIVFAVKANSTSRKTVKKAIEGLKSAKGNIIGVMLTCTDFSPLENNAYYYNRSDKA
ncbi:MAG: polysaccharide biosynthesis tyrosine autokinase [Thermodesulfovibrionia bacterium]|nr:polysaccharide biosynthesis tyrosine autokinase [Thermodesulfovibrionia bacterium]